MIRNEGSRHYQTALREAALTPALFKEIHDTRSNASDDTLAHYLIMEKNFTPDGASRFIKSFRGTMATAEVIGGVILSEDDDDFAENAVAEDDASAEAIGSHAISNSPPVTPVAPITPEGFISLPIPLDATRIVTVIMPIQMNESEWDRFDRVLKGFRPLTSK